MSITRHTPIHELAASQLSCIRAGDVAGVRTAEQFADPWKLFVYRFVSGPNAKMGLHVRRESGHIGMLAPLDEIFELSPSAALRIAGTKNAMHTDVQHALHQLDQQGLQDEIVNVLDLLCTWRFEQTTFPTSDMTDVQIVQDTSTFRYYLPFELGRFRDLPEYAAYLEAVETANEARTIEARTAAAEREKERVETERREAAEHEIRMAYRPVVMDEAFRRVVGALSAARQDEEIPDEAHDVLMRRLAEALGQEV